MRPGTSQRFHVEVAGRQARVSEWSVNDLAGGNASFGRITAEGFYTAPAAIPRPHEIHIRAVVEGVDNPKVWATVLVGWAASYRLVDSWGEKGDGPAQFTDPHSICFDKNGNLIITDSAAARIRRFTPEGKLLGTIGAGPGTGPGEFNGPRDAKLDADGNIFVADGNNHRIEIFTPKGKFLRMFGHKGSGPGEMLRVHAIDFGRKQRLYADDVDNSRVMVYKHSGKFLFSWGKAGDGPGEFHAPHGIGVDPNGDVFVSNYYGPSQKFTDDGKFLFEFGAARLDGPTHFHSMTLDRWGDVYLAARDKDNRNSIVKYNNNGTFVVSWPPLRPASEWGVKAVAIDPNGTVYAAIECADHVGIEVYAEE